MWASLGDLIVFDPAAQGAHSTGGGSWGGLRFPTKLILPRPVRPSELVCDRANRAMIEYLQVTVTETGQPPRKRYTHRYRS